MGQNLRETFIAEYKDHTNRFKRPILKQKILNFASENKVKVQKKMKRT